MIGFFCVSFGLVGVIVGGGGFVVGCFVGGFFGFVF